MVFVIFYCHQISKTLVDVQLENNRIQEDAEATNFDLGNKVSVVQLSLSAFQMMVDRKGNTFVEATVSFLV